MTSLSGRVTASARTVPVTGVTVPVTRAVWFDSAEVEPAELVAVTRERIVCPRSAATSVYEEPV